MLNVEYCYNIYFILSLRNEAKTKVKTVKAAIKTVIAQTETIDNRQKQQFKKKLQKSKIKIRINVNRNTSIRFYSFTLHFSSLDLR